MAMLFHGQAEFLFCVDIALEFLLKKFAWLGWLRTPETHFPNLIESFLFIFFHKLLNQNSQSSSNGVNKKTLVATFCL